jgi:hypothetical protein
VILEEEEVKAVKVIANDPINKITIRETGRAE